MPVGTILGMSQRVTRITHQGMNLLLLRIALIGVFISVTVVSQFAGHPLVNDDARTVDAKGVSD